MSVTHPTTQAEARPVAIRVRPTYDPAVMRHQIDAMMSISRLVSRGSVYYFRAELSADSIQRFCQKMHERYNLMASPDSRKSARRRGHRVYSLIIYPRPRAAVFDVWMLATDGEHPLHSIEKWRDARKDKIQFNCYELVREPLDAALKAKYVESRKSPEPRKIKAITWTWRYARERMDQYRADIRSAGAANNGNQIARIAFQLAGTAGFRAARGQVMELHRAIKDECDYRGRACPEFPAIRSVGKAEKSEKRRRLSLEIMRIRRAASQSSSASDSILEAGVLGALPPTEGA